MGGEAKSRALHVLALLASLHGAVTLTLPKPLLKTGNNVAWLLTCLKQRSASCRLGIDVEVRPAKSKGQGLFALRRIAEGSLIGRYDGELLTDEEYEAKLEQMADSEGMY